MVGRNKIPYGRSLAASDVRACATARFVPGFRSQVLQPQFRLVIALRAPRSAAPLASPNSIPVVNAIGLLTLASVCNLSYFQVFFETNSYSMTTLDQPSMNALYQATSAHRSHQVQGSVGQTTMPRNRRVSCFDATRMPVDSIRKRELHAFSVHYSVATSKWIATLARARPDSEHCSSHSNSDEKRRCVSFPFTTEREARKFAKVYSPPKRQTNATACVRCNIPFSDEAKCRAFNCRNCGSQVCDKCSTRWGIRMIPKTYLNNPNSAMTVRSCKSCDWLSNAFCMALLRGSYHDASRFHATGNINLRCTFADISREAMFPIHCAVMGGNVECVKWLVEKEDCPLSVRRDPKSGMLYSVQTSARRTLIDLAMTGKPKIEILSFLIQKNLSVLDTKDPKLAPKTLQTLLGAGFRFEKSDGDVESFQLVESCDQMSTATLDDACIICCEKQMNCVLTPCGHQMCCSDCGNKMSSCPMCKKPCSILKIYRL